MSSCFTDSHPFLTFYLLMDSTSSVYYVETGHAKISDIQGWCDSTTHCHHIYIYIYIYIRIWIPADHPFIAWSLIGNNWYMLCSSVNKTVYEVWYQWRFSWQKTLSQMEGGWGWNFSLRDLAFRLASAHITLQLCISQYFIKYNQKYTCIYCT
jgi:hypothetical protein